MAFIEKEMGGERRVEDVWKGPKFGNLILAAHFED